MSAQSHATSSVRLYDRIRPFAAAGSHLTVWCFAAAFALLNSFGCGPIDEDPGTENDTDTVAGELSCLRPELDTCSELTEGDVATGSPVTLDGVCYRVDGRITVDENAVIIESGTTLYFEEEGGIAVTDDGSLSAEGTEEEPVCFTGIDEEPGFWRGLRFRETDSEENRLSRTVVEYAGSEAWGIRNRDRDRGAIVLTDAETRLEIAESKIRQNAFVALNGSHIRGMDLTISDTLFEENETPILLQAQTADGLAETVQFEDNDVDAAVLYSAGTRDHVIARDTSLAGLPYRIDKRLEVEEGVLEIEPGAHIEFIEHGGIVVTEDGALSAEGTEDEPVYFGGVEAEPGFWRGLRFRDTDSEQNRLSHAIVEHAGSEPWGIRNRDRDRGAIVLTDENTRLQIADSEIRQNAFVALNGSHIRGMELTMSDTVFEDNETPILLQAQTADGLAETVQFENNEVDAAVLYSAGTRDHVIDTDTSLARLPYRIDKRLEVEEGVLEIEPGAHIEFIEHGGINVRQEGALSAVGTEDEPVYFGGVEQDRGFWRGLRFGDSSSDRNELNYVVVEHAGSEPWTLNRQSRNEGGVVIVGPETRLKITNSELRHNDIAAIMAKDTGESVVELSSSTFEDNAHATRVQAQHVEHFSTDLTIEGNDVDAVGLDDAGVRQNIERAMSFPPFDVPYRVLNTLQLDAAVSIEPGTVFEFAEGEGLRVNGPGSLTAVGTSSERIVFEGAQPVPGFWRGLYFSGSWTSENQLNEVVVRHGGGHQWHNGREASRGNVVLAMSGSGTCGGESMVDIANSDITDSALNGIAVRHGSYVTGCGGLEFENNAGHDALYRETMQADSDYSEGGGCFCTSDEDCLCTM